MSDFFHHPDHKKLFGGEGISSKYTPIHEWFLPHCWQPKSGSA